MVVNEKQEVIAEHEGVKGGEGVTKRSSVRETAGQKPVQEGRVVWIASAIMGLASSALHPRRYAKESTGEAWLPHRWTLATAEQNIEHHTTAATWCAHSPCTPRLVQPKSEQLQNEMGSNPCLDCYCNQEHIQYPSRRELKQGLDQCGGKKPKGKKGGVRVHDDQEKPNKEERERE